MRITTFIAFVMSTCSSQQISCKTMQQTGDTKASTSKKGAFNETMQLAARVKALVVSGFDEMLADSDGFIDRAAGFFSRPSDEPS